MKHFARSNKAQKWIVQVSHGGKRYKVGGFDDEVEAARCYDRCVRRLQVYLATLRTSDAFASSRAAWRCSTKVPLRS
jgi:hypothetical protein